MIKVLINLGEFVQAKVYGTPLVEIIVPHLAAHRATFKDETDFELLITNSIAIKHLDFPLIQDAHAAFAQALTLPPPPPKPEPAKEAASAPPAA